MLKKLITGTATEFKYRIPLSFYPFLGLCLVGLVINQPFDKIPLQPILLLIIFTVGLILRVWGSSMLTSVIVVDAKAHSSKLISEGPFALIRNPLYSGAGLMLATIVIHLPLALIIPFGIYASIVGLRLMTYEESLMRQSFGEVYQAYKKRTGRYAPNLFKLHHTIWPDLFHVGNLRDAVLSEFVFVLYGVCLTVSLILHSSRILYVSIIVTSIVGGFIVKRFADHAKL